MELDSRKIVFKSKNFEKQLKINENLWQKLKSCSSLKSLKTLKNQESFDLSRKTRRFCF
jgi:hypothetical protein